MSILTGRQKRNRPRNACDIVSHFGACQIQEVRLLPVRVVFWNTFGVA